MKPLERLCKQMAFMTPVAEHMVCYHVETDGGVELVPQAACGVLYYLTPGNEILAKLRPYIGDDKIVSISRRSGWY